MPVELLELLDNEVIKIITDFSAKSITKQNSQLTCEMQTPPTDLSDGPHPKDISQSYSLQNIYKMCNRY